jgi:Domain of unknown function (DUF6504)
MRRFVSEPIVPVASASGSADAPARGEPSLPPAFVWRGRERRVLEVLEYGKGLRLEGFSGERYLARHEWRLRMDDGEVWSVYFLRHARSGRGAARARWFLKERSTGS